MKLDIELAQKNAGDIYHADLEGLLDSNSLPYGCKYMGPAKVSVDYTFSEDGLFVWGKVNAEISAPCARCLKDVNYPVETEFSEVFKDAPDEDDEAYVYSGEFAELDKVLEDRILLVLPVRFLCSEDCKGLCQYCGADLNDGDCGCKGKQDPTEDSPFSGLKGLFE